MTKAFTLKQLNSLVTALEWALVYALTQLQESDDNMKQYYREKYTEIREILDIIRKIKF